MRIGLLLLSFAILSLQKSNAQTCAPGAAELTVTGSTLASSFGAPPSTSGLTFTVRNNSTLVSAQAVVVRITKPSPAFTITLDAASSGNWTASTAGGYAIFTYTANSGILDCSTSAQLQVTVNRTPPASLTIFPLVASVSHGLADVYPYNNVWTVRYNGQ